MPGEIADVNYLAFTARINSGIVRIALLANQQTRLVGRVDGDAVVYDVQMGSRLNQAVARYAAQHGFTTTSARISDLTDKSLISFRMPYP